MIFLLRRAAFYAVAGFVAVTLNFLLPRLMPGDPATTLFAGYADQLGPDDLASLKEAYGLSDAPLLAQYADYLHNLLGGDLGTSLSQFPTPVTDLIRDGLGWSLLLGTVSVLISFTAGTLLGSFAAWRRGSRFDTVVPPLTMFVGSFPYFFLALLVLYLFAVRWQVLPQGYAYGMDVAPGLTPEFLGSVATHLLLPATTVALVSVGAWVLSIRNTMIGVLDEDYLTMAEAKGLRTWRVMGHYAARNAILPTVTSLGLAVSHVFSGQLLTEVVFTYPGLGNQLYAAVTTHDYPLMQALFLMITISVLAVNFVVDALYAALDPRVRGAATASS
ncbi:ABC transporter permease [Streptosporangium sp. NPDC004379]|uniref:ABC transporter permease n=1 Tax=Streptosporangium sp. NPDC004379 TaxID=3366189 RepID=UPI0036BCD877